MSPHHFLAFPLTENLGRHIVFFRPRGQFFETVNLVRLSLVRLLKGLLEEGLQKKFLNFFICPTKTLSRVTNWSQIKGIRMAYLIHVHGPYNSQKLNTKSKIFSNFFFDHIKGQKRKWGFVDFFKQKNVV